MTCSDESDEDNVIGTTNCISTTSVITIRPIKDENVFQLSMRNDSDWSIGLTISGPDRIQKHKIIKVLLRFFKQSKSFLCDI